MSDSDFLSRKNYPYRLRVVMPEITDFRTQLIEQYDPVLEIDNEQTEAGHETTILLRGRPEYYDLLAMLEGAIGPLNGTAGLFERLFNCVADREQEYRVPGFDFYEIGLATGDDTTIMADLEDEMPTVFEHFGGHEQREVA